MKKIIESLVTLALASSVMSSSFAMPAGMYVGALGGVNQLAGQAMQTARVQLFFGGEGNTNVITQQNNKFSQTNATGGLLLGYGLWANNIGSLGIEGRFNYLNANETAQGYTQELVGNFNVVNSTQLKQKSDFNIVVKPGLFINENSQIYGIAGVAFTRFNASNGTLFVNNIPISVSETLPLRGMSQQWMEKTKSGSIFGIGVEQNINSNLGLRFEYDYLDFGHLTYGAMAPVTTSSDAFNAAIVGSFVSNQATIHMANSRLTLALIYKFI